MADKSNKYTTEDMVNDYLSSVPVSEIARKSNTTRENIYQKLRRMPDYKEVSNALREAKTKRLIKRDYSPRISEIKELRDGGMSTTKISRKLHLSYYAVRELLRNTEYDSSIEAKNKRDDQIREDYKNGKTQTSLAKKYHISQARVSDILHKFTNKLFSRGPKPRS